MISFKLLTKGNVLVVLDFSKAFDTINHNVAEHLYYFPSNNLNNLTLYIVSMWLLIFRLILLLIILEHLRRKLGNCF